jgi:hypothetical protein
VVAIVRAAFCPALHPCLSFFFNRCAGKTKSSNNYFFVRLRQGARDFQGYHHHEIGAWRISQHALLGASLSSFRDGIAIALKAYGLESWSRWLPARMFLAIGRCSLLLLLLCRDLATKIYEIIVLKFNSLIC